MHTFLCGYDSPLKVKFGISVFVVPGATCLLKVNVTLCVGGSKEFFMLQLACRIVGHPFGMQ